MVGDIKGDTGSLDSSLTALNPKQYRVASIFFSIITKGLFNWNRVLTHLNLEFLQGGTTYEVSSGGYIWPIICVGFKGLGV